MHIIIMDIDYCT